jgi:general secretion pathway protein G
MRKQLILLFLFTSCRESASTLIPRIDSDFSSILSKAKMFKVHAGRYPTEEEGLAALVHKPSTYPANRKWEKAWDKIPVDPWGAPYRILLLQDGEIGIYTTGKDRTSASRGNDPDDVNTWTAKVVP